MLLLLASAIFVSASAADLPPIHPLFLPTQDAAESRCCPVALGGAGAAPCGEARELCGRDEACVAFDDAGRLDALCEIMPLDCQQLFLSVEGRPETVTRSPRRLRLPKGLRLLTRPARIATTTRRTATTTTTLTTTTPVLTTPTTTTTPVPPSTTTAAPVTAKEAPFTIPLVPPSPPGSLFLPPLEPRRTTIITTTRSQPRATPPPRRAAPKRPSPSVSIRETSKERGRPLVKRPSSRPLRSSFAVSPPAARPLLNRSQRRALRIAKLRRRIRAKGEGRSGPIRLKISLFPRALRKLRLRQLEKGLPSGKPADKTNATPAAPGEALAKRSDSLAQQSASTTVASTTTTAAGLPFTPVYPTSPCCKYAAATPSECDVNPTWMKLVCQAECGTFGCLPQFALTSCPTTVNPQCGPRTGPAAVPSPGAGSTTAATPSGPGAGGSPQLILIALPGAGGPGSGGPAGPSGPAAGPSPSPSSGTGGAPGPASGASPGGQSITITVETSPGTAGGAGGAGGDGSGAVGGVACADNHGFCPKWAAAAECSNNRGWMSLNCRRSCNTCASNVGQGVAGCRADNHGFCGGWASQNECTVNSGWMNLNCNTSCGCPANPSGLRRARARRLRMRAARAKALKARRLRRRKASLLRRKTLASRRRRVAQRNSQRNRNN